MWTLRETSFGGRSGRYRLTRGKLLRCIDPLRRRYVEFPSELHFDNWLQFWMNPLALKLEPRLSSYPLAANDNPAVKFADLVIRWRDGSTELQVVAPKPTPIFEARMDAIRSTSNDPAITVILRTRDQIRQTRHLTECIERWRQAAALHVDRPLLSLSHQVLQAVPTSGCVELSLLSGAIQVPHTLCEMVAVLSRLHFSGDLTVSPGSYFYGVQTFIWRTERVFPTGLQC